MWFIFVAIILTLYWLILNLHCLIEDVVYYTYEPGEKSLPFYERWLRVLKFGNRNSFKRILLGTVFLIPTICALFSWCKSKITNIKEKEPA